MALPKRFPDRVDVASVRAEAEQLEPGPGGAARSGGSPAACWRGGATGSWSSSTSSTAPGRLQLLVERGRAGPVDLDLGDIVGAVGKAGQDAARRALARGGRAAAAGQDQGAAPGHLPRRHRRRAALPPPLPRPADERGDARRLPDPHAHGHRDPPLPRLARLPRGRDADPPAALRRRVRRAVRHALERRSTPTSTSASRPSSTSSA